MKVLGGGDDLRETFKEEGMRAGNGMCMYVSYDMYVHVHGQKGGSGSCFSFFLFFLL